MSWKTVFPKTSIKRKKEARELAPVESAFSKVADFRATNLLETFSDKSVLQNIPKITKIKGKFLQNGFK